MIPLIFSVGCIAFVNRDKVIDQYNAAYPSDPAKAAAMEQCISENKYFNRLDGDDRARCYHRYLDPAPVPMAVAPSPSPYYSYSPSHLPGNDVRRQEANDSYRSLDLIPSAQAAQPPPPAIPTQPAARTTAPPQQHKPVSAAHH
ncbi:MAG TPA: hypothetical protein VM782_03860, partial [Stellaceae bacterium]|nr:hypothetical protein [Stellaceae bacterium]